jgi:hypothetical protein
MKVARRSRAGSKVNLQEVRPINPIPIRRSGYFANCYSKKEIQEQNRLAKASVVRANADLE